MYTYVSWRRINRSAQVCPSMTLLPRRASMNPCLFPGVPGERLMGLPYSQRLTTKPRLPCSGFVAVYQKIVK